MSILIVDDFEEQRELLGLTLKQAGYRSLVFADSAKDALKRLGIGGSASGDRIDVVLMDLHMPVMDGGEATKTIRRELPDVNVIGLSVHPHTEALMRDAGACAHVQKSDLMTDLYPAIFTAIETDGL